MKKMTTLAMLIGLVIAAAACTNESGSEVSKDDARNLGKADWGFDFCEDYGWYGDGVCDDFCPSPDPDCVEELKCGPFPGGTCAAEQICDIRSCGLGASGTCVDQPDACAMVYAPVCGCDGVTYGNDCERLEAGAMLDHEGACSGSQQCGGIAGLRCPETRQVCDIQGCYPDAGGTCAARPDACTMVYEPVCGCDGVTYGNNCLRLMAGAGLDHEGACASTQQCGGIAGLRCPEARQVCNIQGCYPDAAGTCAARPDACDMVYEPVCGCDGITYSNDCMRLMAGASLDHEGASETEHRCGPIRNGTCEEGQTCDILSCGLGATGQCVTTPDACTMVYDPVCGCNGTTYSNNCMRLMAGTSLDHDGPCS